MLGGRVLNAPMREHSTTDDIRVRQLRPLLPPAILFEEVPATPAAIKTVEKGREVAAAIVAGEDDRLLTVVGPCSIHDSAAARDYGEKLSALATELAEDLLIVMRVYFEKPRTTVGWKGLINDPDLDGSFNINKGLREARRLLVDLADMGLPTGCEFLDTITPQFIADLVSWGAIGARTTESQVHRQLASGLSMPVGFKNGTDGNLKVACDAIAAVRAPHHFMGVTKQGIAAIVATHGNPACHAILRGGSRTGPNFDEASVQASLEQLRTAKANPRLMIDFSHANSRKEHRRQLDVATDVGGQVAAGERGIIGVMIESHLHEGRQDLKEGAKADLKYGVSVTDACVGWEDTDQLLRGLAQAVQTRRTR